MVFCGPIAQSIRLSACLCLGPSAPRISIKGLKGTSSAYNVYGHVDGVACIKYVEDPCCRQSSGELLCNLQEQP